MDLNDVIEKNKKIDKLISLIEFEIDRFEILEKSLSTATPLAGGLVQISYQLHIMQLKNQVKILNLMKL